MGKLTADKAATWEKPMKSIHIICIGDEFLEGVAQEMTLEWLSGELSVMGGTVERAAIIRNEANSIVREIRHALLSAVRILITVGGLGATQKDVTLSAVAKATHRQIELNKHALKLIDDRLGGHGTTDYSREQSAEMARFPEGAAPIPNPSGIAPALVMRSGSTAIMCLPGTQGELHALFRGPLQPVLREIFQEE